MPEREGPPAQKTSQVTDAAGAVEFYLSLGFRLSGFNDRMYSNRDHEDGRVTLLMYRELA